MKKIKGKYLAKMLDGRYTECDSQGHKKPDEKTNYCTYCYRRLDYPSDPRIEAEREITAKLPFHQRPMTATATMEAEREYLEAQKGADALSGLSKLAKELGVKIIE